MKPIQLLLLIISFPLAAFSQADKANCEDHPLITRYPGSVIGWCDYEEFQEYHIAVGPTTGYRAIGEWIEVAGQVYRNYYTLQGERTVTEVYRNYLQAAQQGGFEILAQGLNPKANVGKEIGGKTWLGTAYARNPLPTSEGINLFHGSSTSGGSGYFAGKLSRAEGTVYLTVMAYQHSQSEVLVQVDIIEVAEMEGDLVSVDADYLAKSLATYGKVAIYGIHFDYDKAVILPESKPALEEVARLMKAQPDLNLYVVGHTDMKGSLSYNLNLSKLRAEAVVNALVAEHGIARSRLEGHGVGSLVPVFTNKQDAGRAKNRRVELVEK